MAKKQELTPIQSAALKIAGSKMEKDKSWRAKLNVGDAQPVDVTLRIRGMIRVAPARQPASVSKQIGPELNKVLALMLDKLGNGTGRRVLDKIIDDWAINRTLAEPSESATEQIEASLASMTNTIETMSTGAMGAVSGQLNIELATPGVSQPTSKRVVKV